MSSRILARFERHQLEAQHAAALNKAIGDTSDEQASTSVREVTTAGNELRLRGIPVAGKGCGGGASRGTRPETEALRLDGLRRRRA